MRRNSLKRNVKIWFYGFVLFSKERTVALRIKVLNTSLLKLLVRAYLFSDLDYESLGIKIGDTSILKPLIRAHFYDLHCESHIQKR